MVDPDCYLWSNDQSQLCYNCNACKAGLLGNLREEWRKANIILTVAVVVLIWVYLIACSAFKNAQTEDLFRRYKRGWVWSSFLHSSFSFFSFKIDLSYFLIPVRTFFTNVYIAYWFSLRHEKLSEVIKEEIFQHQTSQNRILILAFLRVYNNSYMPNCPRLLVYIF